MRHLWQGIVSLLTEALPQMQKASLPKLHDHESVERAKRPHMSELCQENCVAKTPNIKVWTLERILAAPRKVHDPNDLDVLKDRRSNQRQPALWRSAKGTMVEQRREHRSRVCVEKCWLGGAKRRFERTGSHL